LGFGALGSAAIILFTGLIFGKIVGFFKLPNVTGYLLGGLIIGPSILGVLSPESLANMELISQVALAFIAFSIGLSFKVSHLKRMGLTPVVIAICEGLMAVILVSVALLIAGFELSLALVLGSIAAATAPASTVLVLKQYKAKGKVTDTLLSVVALDDALALVLFGLSTTFVGTFLQGSGATNLFLSILSPFVDILLAVIIGLFTGFIMKYGLKYFTNRGNRLAILLLAVFLTTGIASALGVSELLANMATGAILANVSLEAQVMDEMSDYITPPIYMMFFVLSGAQLQLSVVPTIGLLGIVYIVFRVVGKMLGVFVGAKVMKAPDKVSKYVGPMLMPQAGVAIGLTGIAGSLLPEYSSQITAVILVGTLIYEFIGPVVTKISLTKAGEISE